MDCFEFMEWNDKTCNLEDSEPTSRYLGAYRNQLYSGGEKASGTDVIDDVLFKERGQLEELFQRWKIEGMVQENLREYRKRFKERTGMSPKEYRRRFGG